MTPIHRGEIEASRTPPPRPARRFSSPLFKALVIGRFRVVSATSLARAFSSSLCRLSRNSCNSICSSRSQPCRGRLHTKVHILACVRARHRRFLLRIGYIVRGLRETVFPWRPLRRSLSRSTTSHFRAF